MYVGKRYTATVEGSVWKAVTCENCRLQWAYKLVRKAEGTGRSPYFLDNDGAADRASAEARQELQKKLENDVDAVSCPQCHHYQAAMLSEAKYDRFGHWYGFGMIVAFVGLLFCGFWGDESFSTNWVSMPGVTFFVVAIGMAVYGAVRSAMFEPNAAVHVEERKVLKAKAKAPVILRRQYEDIVATVAPAERRDIAEIRWN
ncbi:MAG: hypothetical protein U0228_24585 [Myxococcaceae bacterium]